MNTKKLLTALFSTLLIVGIAVPGPGAASSTHQAASSAAGVSAKHKAGRYQGKVGTFARIILKTDKRKVKKLDAGVSALCQRTSDGHLRGPELVAMRASTNLRIKRNGKFSGEGQTEEGVAWKVSGKFVSKKKAKGKFEASLFRTVFNPFVQFDGELCSGSGNWTAHYKR